MTRAPKAKPAAREPIAPEAFARACGEAALAKKATEVVVLDVAKLTFIADYFVVATASNFRQAQAVADEVSRAALASGRRVIAVQGTPAGGWLLIDASEVVVHVFLPEHRRFYDLEGLWAEAPRTPLAAAPDSSAESE